MENAADALKMAFAVMVFVIALTLMFSMVSQARQTSDIIFQIEDDSKYFQDGLEGITYLTSGENERIVGWETVVSAIYRYNIEEYGVTIVDTSYSGLDIIRARFDYDTESIIPNWDTNNDTYGENATDNTNTKLVNKLKKQVLTEYGINTDSYSNKDFYTYVFKRIYQTKTYSTGNTNSPWLSGEKALKERLRVDLQSGEETITFAGDQTTYTGLHLADDYSNSRFKEKINVIPETKENGDVGQYIEIIYEVQ